MNFSCLEFCADFPNSVKSVLVDEGFDTLPALLCAREADVDCLDLKRGHKALLRERIRDLKSEHGKAPSTSSPTGGVGALSQLLGSMDLTGPSKACDSGRTYFRIVEFVSSALASDEKVTLGQGVTLKMASRVKLGMVSPAMWITANSRILGSLIDLDADFNAREYLRYTKMIGKLASRYTWQSVLLFDDEYRQRQAKFGLGDGKAALLTYLQEQNYNYTGTVQINCRGFPAELKTQKLQHRQTKWYVCDDSSQLMASWRDKKARKPCILVSTHSQVGYETLQQGRERDLREAHHDRRLQSQVEWMRPSRPDGFLSWNPIAAKPKSGGRSFFTG